MLGLLFSVLTFTEGIFVPPTLTPHLLEQRNFELKEKIHLAQERGVKTIQCGMFSLTLTSELSIGDENAYLSSTCFALDDIISSRFIYDEKDEEKLVRVKLKVLPMGNDYLGTGYMERYGCPGKDGLYRSVAFSRLYSEGNCDRFFGKYDISININSQNKWHFGLDARPSKHRHDLVTVVTHEVLHGMGFITNINSNLLFFFDNSFNVPLPTLSNYEEIIDWAITPKSFVYKNFGNTGRKYPNQPSHSPPYYLDGSSISHYSNNLPYDAPPSCKALGFYYCNSLMTRELKKGYSIQRLGGNTLNLLDNMGFRIKDCRIYSGNRTECLLNYCDYCLSNKECGLLEMADYIWGTCPDNNWELAVQFSSAPSLFPFFS